MNLKTDPRLNNMHPLKREILFRLSHTSTNLSPEELLPQVMKINQELKETCPSQRKNRISLLTFLLKI